MRRAGLLWIVLATACGSQEAAVRPSDPTGPLVAAVRLPRGTGEHFPSLVAIDRTTPRLPGENTDGEMLSDVDSCATCHTDAAAHWSASPHSFASFGNPIYRTNVEMMRHDLGNVTSQHCGGCHDMPLMVDGMMTSKDPVPAADLRAHSGVTCRLCHGIQSTTKDGNGSYVWARAPIEAPEMGNAKSIAKHKQQASVKKIGTELCVGCHRGFLSPDMGMPVHLSGLDEPGMWRNSAWTGNGMGRVDKVENKTCIDCHMEREPATTGELGAKDGTIASHRFLGGHTWMASMRGDDDHLARLTKKLEGVASIDVAGARVEHPSGARWYLPADGAPVAAGSRISLDVVLRNLLVGHRFPGGVLDAQDTWVEVEVEDRRGRRLAASGVTHATDATDEDTHVLRTLVVDDDGHVLEEHEVAKFRAQIATHTIAPREAQAVRYGFVVPANLAPDQLPLAVTARLRHRSRSLKMQAAACTSARTPEGEAFIAGARRMRDVELDPCKAQPITLVAETRIELGRGATPTTTRPAWQRIYEHGMALVATVVIRQDEPRAVLEAALRVAPDPRSRAMISAQLGWVAAKQGRADDAVRLVHDARELLAAATAAGPVSEPPVLDAIIADAFVRLNRWDEALAPAKSCTERAPKNTAAWGVYAKVLVALGEHTKALAAATRGLELNPRDPELLRSQATALSALRDPRAEAAQTAYVRFRIPDEAAGLRVRCIKGNERCMRLRNPVHTLALRPAR